MGKNALAAAMWLVMAPFSRCSKVSTWHSAPPAGGDRLRADACESHHWLVVLSTGRAGSTTILSMMNQLPSVHLSGENNGVMANFQTLNAQYTGAGRRNWTSYNPTEPWYRVKPGTFQGYLCSVIASMAPHARDQSIRGFKEIRWKASLSPSIAMLPRVRFIVNYRLDLRQQARSGFFGHRSAATSAVIEDLQINTTAMINAVQATGVPYFLLPLEAFSTTTFNELLHWLGIEDCRQRDHCRPATSCARIYVARRVPVSCLEGYTYSLTRHSPRHS